MPDDPDKPIGSLEKARETIMTVDPAKFGLRPTPELPRVWAVLAESRYKTGPLSVVACSDGTASLWIADEVVAIPPGMHRPVQAAAIALMETVEWAFDEFEGPSDGHLPDFEEMRFQVLTFDGTLSAGAPERTLLRGIGPLSSLAWARQALIAQLKLLHRIQEAARKPVT